MVGFAQACLLARKAGNLPWVAAWIATIIIGSSHAAAQTILDQQIKHLCKKGGVYESVATQHQGVWVTIAPVNSLPNQNPQLQWIGHDGTSRLCFFRAATAPDQPAARWSAAVGPAAKQPLQALTHDGYQTCRSDGWVKLVGDKVLPLALLKIHFTGKIPAAGTPLLDSNKKIIALLLEASGSPNQAYAIPCEAVHRVGRDLLDHGKFTPGWLGLALRTDQRDATIVRVIPSSPAATAGLQAGDLIQEIDGRPISDYADAAQALFYLYPNQKLAMTLLRGNKRIQIGMIPTIAPTK